MGKRELILVFSYVCSVCACLDLSVSSSSLGLERAAVFDCGTPCYVSNYDFATLYTILSHYLIKEKLNDVFNEHL